MADGVFNISKGAFAEKFRDSTGNGFLVLLKVNETETTLVDYDTLAAMLSSTSNLEADADNYARKTSIEGTITVDDTNDRVDLDVADQTWTALGGSTDNTLTKAIFCYEESTGDSGVIPGTHHDFALTTDGSDVTLQVNASGIFRSS